MDRTVDEIRRYSKRDALKFAELCELWCDFRYVAAPYLMDHPTRPRVRTISELSWRVLRKRKNLAPVVGMLLASPHRLIDTLFESAEVKSLLAAYASGSEAALRELPGLWHTGAGAHPMGGVHGWAGRTTARQVLKSLRG